MYLSGSTACRYVHVNLYAIKRLCHPVYLIIQRLQQTHSPISNSVKFGNVHALHCIVAAWMIFVNFVKGSNNRKLKIWCILNVWQQGKHFLLCSLCTDPSTGHCPYRGAGLPSISTIIVSRVCMYLDLP